MMILWAIGKRRLAWDETQKRNENEDFQNLMLLSGVQQWRLNLPSLGVDRSHHQLAEFGYCYGIKIR